MWGYLFNPTSIQPRFRLVYFLSLCPHQIMLLPYGIGILGVPVGFVSFISLFWQEVLNKNVRHVNVLLRLGDV
jgi:hypothetical protein